MAHETPKSKHGHVLSATIMNVLEKTDSTSTLQILAMDGEASNTGVNSRFFGSLIMIQFLFFVLNEVLFCSK